MENIILCFLTEKIKISQNPKKGLLEQETFLYFKFLDKLCPISIKFYFLAEVKTIKRKIFIISN